MLKARFSILISLLLFLLNFKQMHSFHHETNKSNIISYAQFLVAFNQQVRIKKNKYQNNQQSEAVQQNNSATFERVVDIARDVYVCTVSSSNMNERRNAFMRILDTIKNGILSFVCNDCTCHYCK